MTIDVDTYELFRRGSELLAAGHAHQAVIALERARDAAPMVRAPDAELLDTTEMTIEQAADAARRIVEAARARWEASQEAD